MTTPLEVFGNFIAIDMRAVFLFFDAGGFRSGDDAGDVGALGELGYGPRICVRTLERLERHVDVGIYCEK